MKRITLLAPILSLMAVGCMGGNPFQQNRDYVLREMTNSNEPVVTAPVAPAAWNVTASQRPSEQEIEPTGESKSMAPWISDRSKNIEAHLTLNQALDLALRRSQVVRVAQGRVATPALDTFYDVEAAQQRVNAALAAFDASFEADFYTAQFNNPPDSFFGPGLSNPDERHEAYVQAALSKNFVTGATGKIAYNPEPGYLYIPGSQSRGFNPAHVSELEFSVTQPLLRGAGLDVNLAPIEISQLAAEQTAWDFKKSAMESVRNLSDAYWDLYASRIALQSIEEVLPLLQEIVRLQEEAYKTEWIIYADVAKAYSRLHDFRQRQVQAQSAVAGAELRLRNIMGVAPADGFTLLPTTAPLRVARPVDAVRVIQQAHAHQPDVVRQKLAARIREVELLIARNQMQPQLDVRALYRMNGIGEDVGDALQQMLNEGYGDWEAGVAFSVPLGRRAARAEVRAAQLQLAEANRLFTETQFSVTHRVGDGLRRIDFAHREFLAAQQRLDAADDWLKGARLRYRNPTIDGGDGTSLLPALNDYFDALRARTDAAAEAADALARYNAELVRLEEIKGTLLGYFEIHYVRDPCGQCQPHSFFSEPFVRVEAAPQTTQRAAQPISATPNATTSRATTSGVTKSRLLPPVLTK